MLELPALTWYSDESESLNNFCQSGSTKPAGDVTALMNMTGLHNSNNKQHTNDEISLKARKLAKIDVNSLLDIEIACNFCMFFILIISG
jgi:hypothetical protein